MENPTMSIEKEVIDIVVEKLGVDADQVTADKSFVDDLKADSLDLTELIMSFEERFEIDIPEDVVPQLSTIGDAISYIKKEKEKKGP
jgi:acyl carrier protein